MEERPVEQEKVCHHLSGREEPPRRPEARDDLVRVAMRAVAMRVAMLPCE